MAKITTAKEALKVVKSGDFVYIHGGAAVPEILVNALVARAHELKNVTIGHIHIEGDAPYADPKYKDSFYIDSFFLSKNVRHIMKAGNGSYTPIFLSDMPLLFDRKHINVDACKSAIRNAKYVIAKVNKKMPRTYGDALVHIDEIDYLVEHDAPIFSLHLSEPNAIEKQIARHIVPLIEDGSTLQLGIGSIPNATLDEMGHLKNLGIHTELLTEGVLDLVKKGVINGYEKKIDKGKIIASFAMGSQKLYDFIDHNPSVEMAEASYTNEVSVIRQNPKMVSINSAIEVDITGQVCADSIGSTIYSGFGGQIDFVRGAMLSEGGKSIITFPSITNKGESKIVPFLKQGAGVVTTRAHVQYIVTEYGVAELFGKNLKDRAKALIAIAHPNYREALERAAFEMYK